VHGKPRKSADKPNRKANYKKIGQFHRVRKICTFINLLSVLCCSAAYLIINEIVKNLENAGVCYCK